MSIRVPDFSRKLLCSAPLKSLIATSSLAQETFVMPPPSVAVVELRQNSVALSDQHSAQIAATRPEFGSSSNAL